MAQGIVAIPTETLDIKFSWSECTLLGGGSCPRQCYDHQKIYKSVRRVLYTKNTMPSTIYFQVLMGLVPFAY